MRAFLLCALLAGAAYGDTSAPPPAKPGTPRPLPRPKSAAWHRVDHTIADHCRHTQESACKCVLDALRAKPPELSPEWDHDLLVLTSDLFDVVIEATLAPRGADDWSVVRLQCTSLLNPRF